MARIIKIIEGVRKLEVKKLKNYLKADKLAIVLLVVALGTLVVASYFQRQFTVLKQNPQKLLQEETERLVGLVSQLIILPENEMPTVATVSDPEKLKDQPFFTNTKKGDKVLIYTNARKAILYDPENHKIIEVAPLNIGE